MARNDDGGYGGAYADEYAPRRADPAKARGRHGATARDGAAEGSRVNVNEVERVLSVAGGAALAAYALKRRDWAGLGLGVLGGFLVERGVSGHCVGYDALGLTTAPEGEDRGRWAAALPHHEEGVVRQRGGSATVDAKRATKIERAFTIANATPDQLYAYWRKLENLPRIFSHLERVTERDGRRSHWVAKAPAGRTVEWDAEIVNDVPGQTIAWRSVEGSQIPNAGAVNFREAPGGRGTEVKVTLDYQPPLGKLGVAVARLFGEEPEIQVREDLRRFKALQEAGEIPVSEIPAQGTRARATFDAQVNRGETGGDVRELQRRASADAHQPEHQPPPGDAARGRNSLGADAGATTPYAERAR